MRFAWIVVLRSFCACSNLVFFLQSSEFKSPSFAHFAVAAFAFAFKVSQHFSRSSVCAL